MSKVPEQVLGGEDHDAGRVEAEEDDFVALAAGNGLAALGQQPVVGAGDGARAAGHRLEDVGDDRNGDEEAGDVVEDQRRRRRVRVLEGAPHLLAQVALLGGGGGAGAVGVLAQLVVEQPFGVLALPVAVVLVATVADDVRHDAEEGQLFVVAGQTLVLRIVQLARSVVVEDVPEDLRIAVEKVLFDLLVVEELALVRAQQRVRILFQRVAPRLEPPS